MSDDERIECQAERRGRVWTVRVEAHEVYAHGRTLKALRENVVQGLELAGVAADVTLIPTTPELEKLRAAKDAYTAALIEAAAALHLRRTTLRDIALATGEPTKTVKELLAESTNTSEPLKKPPAHSPTETVMAPEESDQTERTTP